MKNLEQLINDLIIEMLNDSNVNISIHAVIDEFNARFPGNYKLFASYYSNRFKEFNIIFENIEEEVQWKLRWL